MEEESREKKVEKEEEAEEGAIATILGNMKRTLSNADALRWFGRLQKAQSQNPFVKRTGFMTGVSEVSTG